MGFERGSHVVSRLKSSNSGCSSEADERDEDAGMMFIFSLTGTKLPSAQPIT